MAPSSECDNGKRREQTARPSSGERQLEQAVERAKARRDYWLKTGEWPLGRALAMMGRFGWTIVTPILLGAFVGRWLDRRFNSGVFWSAALLFAGAAAGFWGVWRRMNSE